LEPALKNIGGIIRTSVVRNFEKGGRPVKWKEHSKLTKARRGAGAPILVKQGFEGGLMGSISVSTEKDSVIVGTNKEYAAVHQFGAKKGSFGEFAVRVESHERKISQAFGKPLKGGTIAVRVKAHTRNQKLPWGDIPARPFMMIQDEDWTEIQAALAEHIEGPR
jgi:phage virion morphogenesis protein